MPKLNLPDFQGVRNSSQSLQEVTDHFGLSKRSMTMKASWMRSQGHEMKKFLDQVDGWLQILRQSLCDSLSNGANGHGHRFGQGNGAIDG